MNFYETLQEFEKFHREKQYADPALQARSQKFASYFPKLTEYANQLVTFYKSIIKNYGYDTGKVDLYLVGGRTKGKDIHAESDLDLIFVVERNSIQNGVFNKDPLENLDYRIILQRQLLNKAFELAKKFGANQDIHIIDFGHSSTPPIGEKLNSI